MEEPLPAESVAEGTTAPLEFSHPLPRLTSKVFTDLAIWMTGFGLAIGVIFPVFVRMVGVPARYVMTERFFVATIGAGLVVGATNQFLSRVVVRSRLQFMRSKMLRVEEALRKGAFDDDACAPEKCSIPVDSDDELGEAAASFNHLVEALAESHRAKQVTSRFATTLSSHIEPAPLAEAALADLQNAGSHSASALYAVSDTELAVVAANGIVEPSRLAASELVHQAYRTLETRVVELPEDLLLDGGVVAFRPRMVVLHPLHVGRVPIGVIVVASAERISKAETQLIQQLLPNFAVALANAISHERLQRIAAVDALTGLYNRRLGLERLGEELSRSNRLAEPLGVVLFDIDHFKVVNDTYGHQTGDRVLRAVADAVGAILRDSDTLVRYGGEEFLALLPSADEVDVRQLSERIRAAVESCTVVDGLVEVSVTVSVGAISHPGTGPADVDDLIRQADTAMYAAKNAGRNTMAFSIV
jgi:diguanylate cyclase (GGDEF)-like protein